MINSKSDKKRILHRLKIIKGHVNCIEKMVDNDAYCVNIIHQSLAVQKALKKFDLVIMKEHLTGCVIEQAKKGETDKISRELVSIYGYK